jgi:formate dehydrogenase accessory protein FdhE
LEVRLVRISSRRLGNSGGAGQSVRAISLPGLFAAIRRIYGLRDAPAEFADDRVPCPRCNSLPVLGVLRPEGDGGKRFLLCAFCSQEWEFRRILCAFCGEEREDHLPVYVSDQLPHIRVESCQTCKHYLRSVDLTKDGNAVPLVDDLAAIPLGLWAAEQGLRRIQCNLLGT